MVRQPSVPSNTRFDNPPSLSTTRFASNLLVYANHNSNCPSYNMNERAGESSVPSAHAPDEPNQLPSNPVKRGRGRPRGTGKKSNAHAPEPEAPAGDPNDPNVSDEEDINYIASSWDPMHWRDVVVLLRELFSHLVPCGHNWPDEQRARIANMLIDLGFALMPANY
ncbi:hypothetical protein CF326_g9823 [Tilletia indica]|nr:hypothetical protein CF326_g9823 [Tilletia indica]